MSGLPDPGGIKLDVEAMDGRVPPPIEESFGHVLWNGFAGRESAFIKFFPTGETKKNEDTGLDEDMFLMREWSCRHPRGKIWPPMRRQTAEDLAAVFRRVEL